MNSEHPNLSIVNRILDILDALRQGQDNDDDIKDVEIDDSPKASFVESDTGSNAKQRLKEAFLKKLDDYKRNVEKPEAVKDLKKALLAKINKQKEKMENELLLKKTTLRTKMRKAILAKVKNYESEI